MKEQKLYIMSGCPGSGKSTYARNHLMDLPNTIYISRDEIRFGLIKENEAYFSKENIVYKEFIKAINKNLANGKNVIVDATHLNHYSRLKLFNKLAYFPVDVETIIIFMDTPLEECIRRNAKRAGTRSYVPPYELEKMFRNIERPYFDEYYKIDTIAYVGITSTVTAHRYEENDNE